MKLKALFAALLACTFLVNVNAQDFAAEKTVELTGKSKKRGYLGNVVVDDTKQQFDMVFVTKSTNKKVKFEVYQFDYDFNLINNFSDEQELSNAKKKNKKIKYRGQDQEVYTGVTAQGNMIGKLVLKKIQTIYTYNWWNGNYEKEVKVVDKEKPKEIDSDGGDKKRKLFYTSHRDLSMKGELLVCALVNTGVMKMAKEGTREYLIMRVNSNLDIVKKTPLKFDHPQSLLYSVELEDRDEWVMVFQTFGGQGYGKIADPDPTRCTFVRIDGEGNIIENFNFKTKCNYWAIQGAYYVGNDIYLYGGGEINKPEKKYTKAPYFISADKIASQVTPEQRLNTLENQKYENLQIVKISNGRAEFVSAPTIEEINAKGLKPDSQKKLKEFDGKKFVINGVNLTSNGDLFINGQDFSIDAVGKTRGRVYKNFLMFQFDKTGNIKRYYGVENTAKGRLLGGAGGAKSFPSEHIIYESPNGKDLFWNIFLCADIDVDCETESSGGYSTTTCTYMPLYQGRMGKIDIASGSISDFKTYGGDDFYLYIDLEDDGQGKDLPYFHINNGKELVYVARKRKGGLKGSERWGNEIWFGKFDPLGQP